MTGNARRPSRWAITLAVMVTVFSAFVIRAQLAKAEFTAIDILGVNRLATGRLDVAVGDATTTLSVDNMAPGDTAYGQLELVNSGTLPLVYSLSASIDDDGLAQSLRFSLFVADVCDSSAGAEILIDEVPMRSSSNSPILGDPTPGRQPGDRLLGVAASDVLCYSVQLPLEATNIAQGTTGRQTFTVHAEHDISQVPIADAQVDP